MLIVWFLTLFVSLYVLLKSADFFIDSAVVIGNKLNIPHFVLGATVIAFGTSLPELAVGFSAIFKNDPAIISGTVIGSNISNIFLITGLAVAVSSGFNIDFKKNASPLIILLIVTGTTTFFLWDNEYTLTEGIISIVLLIAYIAYIVIFPSPEDEDEEDEENIFSYKTILILLASGVGISLGAEYVVVAIKKIAEILDIQEEIISLTVVALGTSLPELAVTISAAKKKKYGIVLGNVVGSNIFNMLCVIGIPTVVGYYSGHLYIIKDALFTGFSIPLMLLATALLFLLSLLKSTPKWFGYLFVALYLFFIIGTFLKLSIVA